MNQQTRILIGLSAIFLILIGLSAAIYFNSKDLSCGKCQIEFKNTEVLGVVLDNPIVLKVNATDLYSKFINNSCEIRWSRTQGYSYGN